MGRLNPKFAPVPADAYTTPPRAVQPLLRWLDPQTRYCEPTAGNGALVDHLSVHGHRCVAAFDLDPGRDDVVARDALTLSERDIADAEMFIANLPWSHPAFPRLVQHLITLRPLWTLGPARWAHAARSATLVSHCSHILCVPRLKWFVDSPHTHTQDTVWLRFDASHQDGPHFYPREQEDGRADAQVVQVAKERVARLPAEDRMTSAPVRIRQILLVALTAAYPGERLAALDRLQHALLAMGRDGHWLADRLQFEEDPYQALARRRFDRRWEAWVK